ncbi:MAG: hypothetical protein FWG90_08630 [Oscillospiraceae bacterium]|nr:hypothetical protein [Oscillospiraceae bacterium]
MKNNGCIHDTCEAGLIELKKGLAYSKQSIKGLDKQRKELTHDLAVLERTVKEAYRSLKTICDVEKVLSKGISDVEKGIFDVERCIHREDDCTSCVVENRSFVVEGCGCESCSCASSNRCCCE